MSADTFQAAAKYVVALVILIGAFVLIYQEKGDVTQAWTVIGLVAGWIVRDSAGQQATSNAVKTIAAVTPSAPLGTVP